MGSKDVKGKWKWLIVFMSSRDCVTSIHESMSPGVTYLKLKAPNMDSKTENRKYHGNLSEALDALGSDADSARIVGEGASQFLLVTKGNRGVELYHGAGDEVIIDPALGDDLQGEISFSSYQEAIQAALCWLKGCNREELFQ
jgi:hypothetical protein